MIENMYDNVINSVRAIDTVINISFFKLVLYQGQLHVCLLVKDKFTYYIQEKSLWCTKNKLELELLRGTWETKGYETGEWVELV